MKGLPDRWRMLQDGNLRYLHHEACAQLPPEAIDQELRERIARQERLVSGAADAGAMVHILPSGPWDPTNDGRLHYVLLGPLAASDSKRLGREAERLLVGMASAERAQKFPGRVLAVLPSRRRLKAARALLRDHLGWEAVRRLGETRGIDGARMALVQARSEVSANRASDAILNAYSLVAATSATGEVQVFQISPGADGHFEAILMDERLHVQEHLARRWLAGAARFIDVPARADSPEPRTARSSGDAEELAAVASSSLPGVEAGAHQGAGAAAMLGQELPPPSRFDPAAGGASRTAPAGMAAKWFEAVSRASDSGDGVLADGPRAGVSRFDSASYVQGQSAPDALAGLPPMAPIGSKGEQDRLMDRADTPVDILASKESGEDAAQTRGRFRFRLLALVPAAVVLLLASAIAVFQSAHSDTVFPGVRVGNVPLGGMTREEVVSVLAPLLGQRVSEPMVLRGGDAEHKLTLGELGATFDAEAAADLAFAVGRSGGWPQGLADQAVALATGYSIDSPGIRYDSSKLRGYLEQRAKQIDRPVRDAELVIGDDLSVKVTPSVVGRKLDIPIAMLQLERAMVEGQPSATLPVEETAPKRSERDLEDARARLSKALSGPVALTFEGNRWGFSAREIYAITTIEYKPGLPAPAVSIRDDPLRKMAERIAAEVQQPTVDARFDWNGGKPKVIRASQDGRKLDQGRAVEALKRAIDGDPRVVALPVEVARPAVASADVAKMGFKELIDSASTNFAGAVPEKAHNIGLAASRLHGVVVAPGEIFSFNKELGPTTLKSGYQIGFGIAIGSSGEFLTVPSVAGGICQVATTLFQAAFWSGYQVEERYPHGYWIGAYGTPPKGMIGLDATVDDPYLDLQFSNNTGNYLLIQSKVEGSNVEFSLYGTKPDWKVEVDGPTISNVVPPQEGTVVQEEPTMPEGREVWVEVARDGMDVVVTRRVIQGGQIRTLQLKSHYEPSRNTLMVGTKKPEPTATSGTPTATAAGAAPTPPGATPTPPVANAATPALPAASAATSAAAVPSPTAAPAAPTSTSAPAAAPSRTPAPTPTSGPSNTR